MNENLKGKRILITGGAGSVGCALTEAILKYEPETIRILDSSENEMFNMRGEFIGEKRIRYLIGDIRDVTRIRMAMENIDYVIHLAAMKHVYACEYNPFEAIKTNVDGLQNIINIARDENIGKMIFSSTDKATSPTSVLGITKLLGEKLISLANYYKGKKKTIFASVRFGNVLGSSGSVVQVFKKQIKAGGPLTITDANMTRFVITMDEIVKLIYNTLRHTRGGEIFSWKMRTLKVTDLANVMIEKYGSKKRIEIKTIGKYEGEKTHEEIMSKEELSRAIELDNMCVILPLIGNKQIDRKYKNTKAIEHPVIASNNGPYISKTDIKELLENLEV